MQRVISFLRACTTWGKTQLATHHVDTGEAPPVKLPPYKQTPDMRRITYQYVEDYKRNNLINAFKLAQPCGLSEKSQF